ncbi:oligosaccharide flippase family protein [Paraglaciecola marina]|uniref:oligosaccharide flippase family protein n=1 Tax=Paraglaciecola marina TaxID=2500157 RepID=UPI00105F0B34|nr:oligosaccharide flippase family protein [Paraglaciecola marina]
MQLNRDIVKSIAGNSSIKILGTGINFLLPMLISRVNGLDVLGQYYIFIATVYGVSLFSRMGLDYWIIKEVSSKDINVCKSIYFTCILYSFLLSLGVVILIYGLEAVGALPYINLDKLGSLSIGVLCYSILMLNVGFLRSVEKQITASVLENLIIPLLIILFVIITFVHGEISFITLEDMFVISVLTSLFVSFILISKLKFLSGQKFLFEPKALKKAWPYFGVSVTSYAQNWLATIIISINLTNEDVGMFNICHKVIQFSTSIQNIIASIYSPKFGKALLSDDLKRLAVESRAVSFKIGTLLIVLILLMSPLIFSLTNITDPDSFYIVAVLSLGFIVSLACGPVGKVLAMSGFIKYERNILMAGLLLSCLLTYVFTLIFGVLGAAVSMTTTLIMSNVLMVIFVKRKLGFTLFKL